MTAYDSARFQPPAPVARVTLRDPSSGMSVSDVPLLIDMGADFTLLPRDALDALGGSLLTGELRPMMGFNGARSTAPVVQLDMLFLRRTFRGEYVAIEEAWGILGRDILKHLHIVLDGPRAEWSEQ